MMSLENRMKEVHSLQEKRNSELFNRLKEEGIHSVECLGAIPAGPGESTVLIFWTDSRPFDTVTAPTSKAWDEAFSLICKIRGRK